MSLRIMVAVKAVPETAPPPPGSVAAGGPVWRVNEYDLFAVEEAVRIKERMNAEVTVVSAGPPRVEEQIRKAMALGADRGFRLDLGEDDDADPLRVAGALAAFARDRAFDLILCGVMSEDRMRSAVGPMLAELLGLPSAAAVVALFLDVDAGKLACERELFAGARELVSMPLPAVLTIQSGINVPRYASLSHVLRVKKLEVPAMAAADLGPLPAMGAEVRWVLPERGACEFLAGSPEEVADRLVERIRQAAPRR